jgi:hypothetical protein
MTYQTPQIQILGFALGTINILDKEPQGFVESVTTKWFFTTNAYQADE